MVLHAMALAIFLASCLFQDDGPRARPDKLEKTLTPSEEHIPDDQARELRRLIENTFPAAEGSRTRSDELDNMLIPTGGIPDDLSPEIRGLIEKTFSDDAAVRGKAALDLGRMGERATAAVPFLIRLFPDNESFEMKYRNRFDMLSLQPGLCAMMSLEQLGIPRADLLIATLKDPHSERRWTAAALLGEARDPRSVGPLIDTLKDEDKWVRSCAIGALAELANPQAIEPLAALMNDGSQEDFERGRAAWALGKYGDRRAVEALLALVTNKEENSYVRREAAVALGYTRDQRGTETLLGMMNHQDKWIRRSVFWGLARAARPEVIEPLAAALKDISNDPATRRAAAIGLGRTKDPRAAEHLLVAVDDETNHHIRFSVFSALAISADPRATARVVVALQDSNVETARAAAWALQESTDPTVVEPLIAALKHPDLDVRANAVTALEYHKDLRAVGPLRALLENKNEQDWVKDIARSALARSQGPLTPFDEFALGTRDLFRLQARRKNLGP